MKSTIFPLLFSLLLLVSCSNDDVITSVEKPDPTLNKCLGILQNFQNEVGDFNTRATAASIISFEKKTLKIPTVSTVSSYQKVKFQSGYSQKDSTDIELCFLEFENGDSKGYAFVSPDERLNSVYAYVPNGSINDTTVIAPLDSCIKYIPKAIEEDLVNTSINTRYDPIPTSKMVLIRPIVRTKWGQEGFYCKYIIDHYAVGCGPLAAAQVIAACGKFKGTYYGNRDINFKELTSTPTPQDFDTWDKVAAFLHEVAIFCQVRFGNQSSSYMKSIYHYLTELGYTCDYREGPLDYDYLYQNLHKGIPHIIGGHDRTKEAGHAWVIDGLNAQMTLDNHFMSGTVHCNWGQYGDSNGWFRDYTHFVLKKEDIDIDHNYNSDNEHIYITNF